MMSRSKKHGMTGETGLERMLKPVCEGQRAWCRAAGRGMVAVHRGMVGQAG